MVYTPIPIILMIVTIEIYVKNAWVSGPDKTLKGWYSQW